MGSNENLTPIDGRHEEVTQAEAALIPLPTVEQQTHAQWPAETCRSERFTRATQNFMELI